MGLWGFLAFSTPFVMLMLIIAIWTEHKKNMKKLENEKLEIQQANVQHEVSDAVGREIKEILARIEVLEAIVTDRKFDLSEKITRLK
ncbi:MAG: hypothetical protein ACJZ83_12580 [Pseudohongiellaceae bacterium]